MKLNKSILALTAATLLASTFVFAHPADAQRRKNRDADMRGHISWVQLVNQLEGRGYQIREIEMKRNGWEVEVIREGRRYELRLDGKGNILRQKRD